MERWKRNLYFIWFAQTMTVFAFSIASPILPLFIQDDLGISDSGQAVFWAGLANGSMGLGLLLFGPIWGMLGDRYGRKKNVLRGMFGGAVSMLLVAALVTSAPQLVMIRFVTGLFSGVFSPALALVASGVPRQKIGYAVGLMQMAFFSGITFGPLAGGFLSEQIGFRNTFYVGAGMALVGGIAVLLFVREDFKPAPREPNARWFSGLSALWQLSTSKTFMPLLLVMMLVHATPTTLHPVLPILVKSMGEDGSAASLAGIAFAVLGAAGIVAAYVTGILSERVSMVRLTIVMSMAGLVFAVPLLFVDTIPLLFLFIGLVGMCQGSLLSSASAVVGSVVPRQNLGAAYGSVQSASSIAFTGGPLLGGYLATTFGLRAAFTLIVVFYFLVLVIAPPVFRKRLSSLAEDSGTNVARPGGQNPG